MPEDYPLKPTDADLDDDSLERQEAVMAWQSEEPVRSFAAENEKIRTMAGAVALERNRYREALERLAKVDPLVEDNLPLIDTNREFEARIRFAEAALKDADA